MEQAVKERKFLRSYFTRTHNTLQKHLTDKKIEEAKATYAILENKWFKLKEKDDEIFQLMINGDLPEEDFDLEYEARNDYEEKYELIKVKMSNLEMSSGNSNRTYSFNEDDHHSTVSTSGNIQNLKLPAIKLDIFDGSLKGWLPFWGQFEMIHTDNSIPTFQKFKILTQSLKEGSRAKQVVDSFPISKEVNNYNAAVEALKERFGREDLLIEVYIRELLEMIVQNSKSYKFSLTDLYDKIECQLRFLEILGVTTGKSAAILCPLLESCMSEDFLRVWQRSYTSDEVKDAEKRLGKFREFIKTEVQNEQRISLAMTKFGISENYGNEKRYGSNNSGKQFKPLPKKKEYPSAMGLLTTPVIPEGRESCIFCNMSHNSVDCFKSRDMTYDEKLKCVRDTRSCYLCLKRSHSSKLCRNKSSCMICDRRHATILCSNFSRNKNVVPEKSNQVSGDVRKREEPVNVTTTASVTCDTSVLLPTLQLKLRNNINETRVIRAVIDSASQRSYVLNSTANKMGFESIGNEKLCISLFGGKRSGISYHKKFEIHMSNLKEDFNCSIEALGQDMICGDLPTVPNGPWIGEMIDACRIKTSDLLNDSGPIELLIGSDVAGTFLTGNLKKLSSGSLVGIETYFGWTISGRLPTENKKEPTAALLTTNMLCDSMSISDLWRLDLIGIDDSSVYKSKDEGDIEAEKFFLDTVTNNIDGRYEVCLPWKSSHSPIPTNYELAEKRLDSTRRKLQKDGFLEDYNTVFEEWEAEGIIEQTPLSNEGHFLPHRHVIKLNSTTKIRPVFDASAHQKHTCSLNQCLERGCNLIEKIPHLLHSFRLKEIGVIADIRKAFLQISVNPRDRKYLKFLWRKPDGKLICYQHNRVVFGLTSSPFLLGAVVKYHLENEREHIVQGNSNYSLDTVDTLLKCFYVDNVVTSVETMTELETFQSEATTLMAKGKFDLRCWEHSGKKNTNQLNSPVLGLNWNQKEDSLSISTESFDFTNEKVTKRTIMSAAHRVFDPIGIVSPVTVNPKILLKELWKIKLDWDDDVPIHIKTQFISWIEDLKYLQKISVPRWLGLNECVQHVSVHTFTDASEISYAAVIFVRIETQDEVKVQLVQSKTRISPVKKMTIPRLELLAATIGSRLFNSVKEHFTYPYESFFWTDSTTVIAWLKRTEHWATFVANRVQEISKLTPIDCWNHIPGIMNPADLPSRGCSGKKLFESTWWEGPKWLYQPKTEWPASENFEFNEGDIVSEKRKSVMSLVTTTNYDAHDFDWYFRYFSQYLKLIRMVAWVERFVFNCKTSVENPSVMKKGNLSVEEINGAEIKVFKFIQQERFDGVTDKKISSLQPFKDHDGLIRLRTKVSNRMDSNDFRFPILLPKDHPVVHRLLQHIHEKECHVGVQGLLGITRERFWIIGGRRTLRKVVSSCVVCKRHSTKHLEAPMAAPPEDRVRQAAAFEVIGIDLAGPIYLKQGQKAWVCLFTCGVYRAIHLELLTSLSTEEFLMALRRFVARRGRPSRIYSDQGTNFKGANNLFRKLQWNKVTEYCDVNRISWKFNPPASPWWGGWWERLVGLVKQILKKTLKRSTLTYQEMQTVICDCESVLNSRPLTFISEGCPEPIALTPSMFIQDVKEAGLPELDTLESNGFGPKWQQRHKLKQNFRNRFRTEYLGMLQCRDKQIKTKDIHQGDIVLIGSDNTKRLDWPLGKVIEIIPGKDGIVRLLRLKTKYGECLRPIQRIYQLVEGDKTILNKTEHEDRKPVESSIEEKQCGMSKYSRLGRLRQKPKRYED